MKKNLSTLKHAVMALGIFISFTATAQFTAVQSGDWNNSATWGGTAPSSTVSNQNVTIPSGITVNLNADVTFSGLLNTFMVNGMLTSTSSNWIKMTSGSMTGTGTVSVNKVWMSSLSTIGFAGTMNLKTFVNSVNSLAFTSAANITDTLELESGNLNINTNGNVTMMAGSTVKVNNGSMAINSGAFNSSSGYNVMYVGSSKNTGIELNGSNVQNVYVRMSSNTQTLSLNNNMQVNGTLDVSMGQLEINSKKLTLNGDLTMAGGTSLVTNNTSDLEIGGSGSLTNDVIFSTGSTMHNFTINRSNSGQVKLKSTVSLAGTLNLMDGNLSIESNGNLTLMNTNATIHREKGMIAISGGTFVAATAYNVEYAGSSDITTGEEVSGSGNKSISIMFSNNTSKVMLNNHLTVVGTMNMNKGKLDLNGKNLMLSGVYNQTGSAWIIGNSSSELHLNMTSVSGDTLYFDNTNANAQTLGKLMVNTSGNGAVVIGSKLIIASELAFSNGKIELGNADLEIMSAATITGYDDTKYVITSDNASGVLIQNVNAGSAYVTFPVGLAADYSPAYVQQAGAGTTGNFSVKCHTLYTTTGKAVNRTWMVAGAGVSNINANLRFGWKAAAEMNSFDRTNAYVSHFTNGAWDMTSAGSASVGVNTTYELSRTGLTSLSPFAVVEAGQPLKVSEVAKQLNGVEFYPNPSKDVLNVKVRSTADYRYDVIDVTGKTIMSVSNTNASNKFDVSGLDAGVYFLKVTNLNENQATTKRFVKQ